MAWVGIGVAGTGFVVGTVMGVISIVRADTLGAECRSDVSCSVEELDEGRYIANGATIAFAIAGAGAITALVALLVEWPEPTPAISLTRDGLRIAF